MFNIYADQKRSILTSNKCFPFVAGVEYLRLKAMLRKKIAQYESHGDKYVGPTDYSKLSIKDRASYKQKQLDANSSLDYIQDAKKYIEAELKDIVEIQNLNKNSQQKLKITSDLIDKIYNEVVISEVNDLILNNILDNKKIYLGVVVVRQERIENLYNKFIEYNNNL